MRAIACVAAVSKAAGASNEGAEARLWGRSGYSSSAVSSEPISHSTRLEMVVPADRHRVARARLQRAEEELEIGRISGQREQAHEGHPRLVGERGRRALGLELAAHEGEPRGIAERDQALGGGDGDLLVRVVTEHAAEQQRSGAALGDGREAARGGGDDAGLVVAEEHRAGRERDVAAEAEHLERGGADRGRRALAERHHRAPERLVAAERERLPGGEVLEDARVAEGAGGGLGGGLSGGRSRAAARPPRCGARLRRPR